MPQFNIAEAKAHFSELIEKAMALGAATAILLLRTALACHNGMATFAEAGVSDRA